MMKHRNPQPEASSAQSFRTCLGLGLLAFLILQYPQWKGHLFEATWIQVKSIVVPANQRDLMQLGAICNSLKEFECSKNQFGELVRRFPRIAKGHANLAIALARLGEFEKARQSFRNYFRMGGRAFDAMYWMGKAQWGLEEKKRRSRGTTGVCARRLGISRWPRS